MGTGYKGNTTHHYKFSENIENLTKKYPVTNGYFGVSGPSGDYSVRNIISENPTSTALDFYDTATIGSIEQSLYYKDGSAKGKIANLADGTIIGWRPISSSKDQSPAVNIDISRSDEHGNIKTQKIHFVYGRNQT